ncbi:MAG: PAS domain-containing protein [Pyrinomonadaceae bacterium]
MTKTLQQAEEATAYLNGEESFSLPEGLLEAERALAELAGVFFPADASIEQLSRGFIAKWKSQPVAEAEWPDVVSRYRILVEQIPAVVFMAFLDQGISEAYVSPQIEAMLGFTQSEWLGDPVRWYQQIHPDDKSRWSMEAAQTFLSGDPLRSVYRVLARDGHVVWFHCEVRMVRHADGRPWFIHGVGFDITELKQTEEALKQTRDGLELRVGERTRELAETNAALQQEIAERQRAEAALLKAHAELEQRVAERTAELARANEFLLVEVGERRRTENALHESAGRMKILSRRLFEVQEAERRNLALELHDQIGQILTGLKLTLEMAARLPPDEARASILQAQTLVNELMARARQLSLDLRPATLDHLGLLSALLWHIKQYGAQTQVRVRFKHNGLEGRRFPTDIETAAYRIVQEALTNIARHAETGEATVRVWADEHSLTIQIEDQGKGFDTETALAADNTSGLAGMRERAHLLGGHFTIESHSGTGTRLTVEFTVSDKANASAQQSGG